jgi:hypothetical protein
MPDDPRDPSILEGAREAALHMLNLSRAGETQQPPGSRSLADLHLAMTNETIPILTLGELDQAAMWENLWPDPDDPRLLPYTLPLARQTVTDPPPELLLRIGRPGQSGLRLSVNVPGFGPFMAATEESLGVMRLFPRPSDRGIDTGDPPAVC